MDRYDTNLWGAGTGSFSSTGSKTGIFNPAGVAVLQGWIDGTISNYGVTIENYAPSDSNSDHTVFAWRESAATANQPTLKIR